MILVTLVQTASASQRNKIHFRDDFHSSSLTVGTGTASYFFLKRLPK